MEASDPHSGGGASSSAGGLLYAEVTVTEPVVHTQSMQAAKHTTYLVEGSLGLQQFSSRKRYSDFEWLRSILPKELPGVMLPALPPKERARRFEETFMEERRRGLEQFLRKLMTREGIVKSCVLLAKFLTITSGPELEALKKEIANRTFKDTWEEYTHIFSAQLDSCQPPSDDSKFKEAKDFLEGHKAQLQDSIGAVRSLCQQYRLVSEATSKAHGKLTALHDEEVSQSFPSGAQRERLLAVFTKDKEICTEAPRGHFEVLLASLESELAESKALDEAIDSIGLVEKRVHAQKKRIEATRAEKSRLVHNPSNSLVVDGARDSDIAEPGEGNAQRKRDMILNAFDKMKGKDPASQLEAIRQQLEAEQDEAKMGEELVRMSRTVCAWYELPAYVKEKIEGIQNSYDQVIDSKAATATRMSDAWGETVAARGPYATRAPAVQGTAQRSPYDRS